MMDKLEEVLWDLCEISLRVKRHVYETTVKPAMVYEAETQTRNKAQEKKLNVAEMRMLRCLCGG